MKITINRKQVWPPRDRTGILWYKFKKDNDDKLVYVEIPPDANGRPDEEHPTVMVEFDKNELEYLIIALSEGVSHSSQDSRTRREILDSLRKLEKINGDTGNKEPESLS